MLKWLNNLRIALAVLALLVAAGVLYFARVDHVPHERTNRVTPADFFSALSRPDPHQRPTDIVVYPPKMGLELITCTAHPPGAQPAPKFFYYKLPASSETFESLLARRGVDFATPWWDANWVHVAPWAAALAALALMALPFVAASVRLLAEAVKSPPQAEQPKPLAPDLPEVRALDDAMESALRSSAGATPPSATPAAPAAPAAQSAGPPIAPAVLNAAPLQPLESAPEEKKDYRGEYYPVAHPHRPPAFTLVELLVVIGIIAVLAALLLPTLSGARRDANQIACAANLRSIGQGLAVYAAQNEGIVPASYSYHGQTIVNSKQKYTDPGYVHWSYFLYTSGAVPKGAFLCPEMENGGLPPTNTTPDNLLPGQVDDTPGAVDDQAPRVAYTLNEALSPRNKFAMGFQGALRVYQFIHVSSLPHPSSTILATEWAPTGARDQTTKGAATFYVYSHRPVHGFIGLDGTLDMFLLPPGAGYRRLTAADLDPDPASAATSGNRLDWVGRNHGKAEGYPDTRKTNFLYVDGHVECKPIYETLEPFEWGDRLYTLSPNDDVVK